MVFGQGVAVFAELTAVYTEFKLGHFAVNGGHLFLKSLLKFYKR